MSITLILFSRILTSSLLLVAILSSFNVLALNITFINPGFNKSTDDVNNSTGDFWYKVSAAMHAASDDLDINLTVYYANRNHILMKELISKALKAKPDLLILVDEKQVISNYLLSINTDNVPLYFLLNRPNASRLHYLIQHNANIVGSMVPDNRMGGRLLAEALFNKHRNSSNTNMKILALLGDYTTPAATARRAGLTDYLNSYPEASLFAEDVANWSLEESYTKTLAFLQNAPEINAIWCANDAIAFGAIKALNTLNLRKHVVVGGINWDTPENKDITLDVSIGGHVLLGAHALLNIYDASKKPEQFPLQHKQVASFNNRTDDYEPLINKINSGDLKMVDFLLFSQTQENHLDFTVENLAHELKNSL